MQVLEDGVPVRPGEPVERVDAPRACRRRRHRPRPCSSVAVRSVTGPRTDCAKFCRASGILLLLERAHAEHQPRDAIVAVDLHQPVGQPAGLVDFAVGQNREEGAAEQFGIARIGLQHVEVIGGRGGGIALDAGMPGGQIAAGGGRVHEFLRRRRLAPSADCRPNENDGAGDGGVPGAAAVNHEISIGETGDRKCRQTGISAGYRVGRENDPFAMPLQGRSL